MSFVIREVDNLSTESFERMVEICCAYDPFTMYIDNYIQERQAVARNEMLNEEFNNLMQVAWPGYSRGVPLSSGDRRRDTVRKNLSTWLWEHEIFVDGGESNDRN